MTIEEIIIVFLGLLSLALAYLIDVQRRLIDKLSNALQNSNSALEQGSEVVEQMFSQWMNSLTPEQVAEIKKHEGEAQR